MSRSTLTITSSISVPNSSFLSRGVVVVAVHTAARSGPSAHQAIALLDREHARALLLATSQLSLRSLKRCQTFLPFALEATRHQPVVGIDGAIATLGKACCIARPLDAKPPVLERELAIHLDLLGSGQRRSDLGGLKRCKECACHGVVDLHAANVEAVAAATLDKTLAGAVISG